MELKKFTVDGIEFPIEPMEILPELPVWEYYYRRGNRHYFRNQYGNKISFIGEINFKHGRLCHIDIKLNDPITEDELKNITVTANNFD